MHGREGPHRFKIISYIHYSEQQVSKTRLRRVACSGFSRASDINARSH